MNTIGTQVRLTTFGESHGVAIGGVLDGFPAGIVVDEDFVRSEMRRRRPGQSAVTTARNEADEVQFLSGIFEGRTTGTPIGFVIYNTNNRSNDYDNLRDAFRPSHADYVAWSKYGNGFDYRGGGKFSGRLTAPMCIAGGICKQILEQKGIKISAFISSIGKEKLTNYNQI